MGFTTMILWMNRDVGKFLGRLPFSCLSGSEKQRSAKMIQEEHVPCQKHVSQIHCKMLPYICRNVWGEGDEYICFSNNMRIQYCMYVRIHTVYINNIHILYLIMVFIYIYTCFYSIYILYLHSYTHVQCTTRMKSTFLSL